MKRRHAMAIAAAMLAACGAPWAAADYAAVPSADVSSAPAYVAVPGEPVVIYEARPLPGSPIHSGAVTWEDEALAARVATALYADRRLSQPGITATIVANHGDVTITGSADSFEQAQRAEQLAMRAARPGRVVGMISTISG